MDAYVLMRKEKQVEREEKKKADVVKDLVSLEREADLKAKEEGLRIERRELRIEREKEDIAWRNYRQERKQFDQTWNSLSRKEKKALEKAKKARDLEWKAKKAGRKQTMAKRSEEDCTWREQRKELRMLSQVLITTFIAVLVIIDNCSRKCYGLPVFVEGKKVTAEQIVLALRQALPDELKYLISDNAKIFIAKAMEEFLKENAVVHVKITPGRANTNGIAERFVRSLKEMLKTQEWKNIEELKILLSTLIEEYNNRPHQGLNGLSPNEHEKRLTTTTSLATA